MGEVDSRRGLRPPPLADGDYALSNSKQTQGRAKLYVQELLDRARPGVSEYSLMRARRNARLKRAADAAKTAEWCRVEEAQLWSLGDKRVRPALLLSLLFSHFVLPGSSDACDRACVCTFMHAEEQKAKLEPVLGYNNMSLLLTLVCLK